MATIFVKDHSDREHALSADAGGSVMQILRRSDLPVMAVCGGSCSCATCHVYIDDAWLAKLAPPDSDEVDVISCSDHYKEGASRLSCQVPFTPDLDGLRLTLSPDT